MPPKTLALRFKNVPSCNHRRRRSTESEAKVPISDPATYGRVVARRLPRTAETLLATAGVRSRAREHSGTPAVSRPGGPPSTWAALGEFGSVLGGARLVGALPRLSAAPRGDGHLVVDIPGWRAPELSGAPMRGYLKRLGYDARGWGFGTNTGDPRRDVTRLAKRVLELVDETGEPASLVGWSLGGVIAREVARRHPAAVRRVVTYGTPLTGRRLHAAQPIQVPLTVVFSKRDGIVSWQACIDHATPGVEHVEVSSTHIGMGIDPDVWAIVADRLGRT